MTKVATESKGMRFYPTYDANGNIDTYLQFHVSNFTFHVSTVAHYEYSPFGQVTFQSGELADSFAYKFSTKYWDSETRLLMYQLRPYSPELGRFIQRDRIEERGGDLLYGFCENDGIDNADILGALSLSEITTGAKDWISTHVTGRGGISGTYPKYPKPPWKLLVYTPPPVWLEINATLALEAFSCRHPKTGDTILAVKGSLSVDGYVAVGVSLVSGDPGKGKARNEKIPNPNNPGELIKRKKAPGEPNSGFRERNRYGEVTLSEECQVCPDEGLTGITGSLFFRGSAGVGVGYQFNIQKNIDKTFTDLTAGWSVTGSKAWGVAGVSLEAGVTITGGVVVYMN